MAQTDIKVGRFVINVMPVFFMILTAVMGTQFQKTSDSNDTAVELAMKVQKENSDLSRRIAATELRARDAEKRAFSDTTPDKGVNVIIINPGAKQPNTLPSKSYADLNYSL